jgi:hypothetical protein
MTKNRFLLSNIEEDIQELLEFNLTKEGFFNGLPFPMKAEQLVF